MTEELTKAEELLSNLGILDKIEGNEALSAVAKDPILLRNRDKTTAIYRLAMTIYHAKRFGFTAIKDLDDPMSVYVRLTESKPFNEKYKRFMKDLMLLPSSLISETIKTFMCYAAAAYLYYKNR